MRTRVVVISNDFSLKSGICAELRKNISFDVIDTFFYIEQAANFFIPNSPNALIVDLEGQRAGEKFLRKLKEELNVFILIVGPHPGIAYMREGITNVIPKPPMLKDVFIKSLAMEIAMRIRLFTNQNNEAVSRNAIPNAQNAVSTNQKVIAIAASTGGTDALPVVISKLPENCPPVIIVQHMPSTFTRQFAERLNKVGKIRVKEAASGDYLKKGLGLLAPGDFHMKVIRKGGYLAVECVKGDKVHGVRPAADVTFNSMVTSCSGGVIGVILTGMGGDGAKGLFELHAAGAKVIAQDEATSVVYGMPKVAVNLGAVDYIVPLHDIGKKVIELI
jgi:two-component system chemotaxis response regulator CheB